MDIKRVAVFHCTSYVGSAWNCAEGIATTLLDMRLDVMNCGNPKRTFVNIRDLRDVDLIILMAPEWYHEVLVERYGTAWFKLKAVKVAWYAESFDRDDRTFDFAPLRVLADLHYFPARQDADRYGWAWLPFGVDAKLFYPRPVKKIHDVAFIGSMYAKRRDYVERIRAPITFLNPVLDADPVTSVFMLAEVYSSIRIVINLPSYSRLLVTRVTEAMACRSLIVTPEVDHPSGAGNHDQFANGETLFYYPPDRPEMIDAIVGRLLGDARELERVTEAGWVEAQHHHSLHVRLTRILADVAAYAAERSVDGPIPRRRMHDAIHGSSMMT